MEIDGIKLQPGDRILFDSQTELRKRSLWRKLFRMRPKVTQNGIYTVRAAWKDKKE